MIDLTKYSVPDVLHEESNNANEEVPKPKRHCVSEETRNKDEVGSCDEHDSSTSTESDKVADSSKGDEKIAVAASPSEVLKKNKTVSGKLFLISLSSCGHVLFHKGSNAFLLCKFAACRYDGYQSIIPVKGTQKHKIRVRFHAGEMQST